MQARLLEFIDALRAARVRPSVAESFDAMAAVATAGIEREALRAALAATLVKDIADRPAFDALFERFFAGPKAQHGQDDRTQSVAEGLAGGRGKSEGRGQPREEPQASARGLRKPPDPQSPQRTDADAQRRARQRALLDIPFESMHSRDVEQAEELVADLARRWQAHLRRRLARATRGRLDFRRTIRRALGSGGVPIDPIFRRRRPGKLDLIALCDVSYSAATAANFCLALLAPANRFFRRVRLYGYVDRPVELSIESGHVIPHAPLDLAARSDFGHVLVRLAEHDQPAFGRNTVLLILGDARNNRRPPRADILAKLHHHVRRIIWLNPEPVARWNTGDSVLASYAHHCDAVLAAGTLRELTVSLRALR